MEADERDFLEGSSVVENAVYLMSSLDVRLGGLYSPKCASSQSQNCTRNGRLDSEAYGPKCASSQSQNCTRDSRLNDKLV